MQDFSHQQYVLKCIGVSHNPPPCRFVACCGFSSAVDWKNSVETTIPYYFPLNPAWLIGILIMVHYNPPHNWVVFHPPTNPLNNQGLFFIVQVILLGFLLHHDLLNPMGNLGKKMVPKPSAKLSMPSPRAVRRPVGGNFSGQR